MTKSTACAVAIAICTASLTLSTRGVKADSGTDASDTNKTTLQQLRDENPTASRPELESLLDDYGYCNGQTQGDCDKYFDRNDKIPVVPASAAIWIADQDNDTQRQVEAIPVLKSQGFTDNDIAAWTPYVTTKYYQCVYPVPGGCNADAPHEYLINIDELVGWKKSGYTPEVALRFDNAGIRAPEAIKLKPWYSKTCKGKIYQELSEISPYAAKGKCFIVEGSVEQLLSPHKVLIQVGAAVMMLNYAKGSLAPPEGNSVSALVMGDTAVKYKSAGGFQQVAYSFLVLVDLADSRDAID